MATAKHDCSERVYDGSFGSYPCSINAKYEEGGKWWCKRHAPSERNKKRQEREAVWARRAAERKQERDEHDELHRRGECFPDLLKALRNYVECDGYDDEIKGQGIDAVKKAEGK